MKEKMFTVKYVFLSFWSPATLEMEVFVKTGSQQANHFREERQRKAERHRQLQEMENKALQAQICNYLVGEES